ncbi:MAG: ATP-grasp domain-containing protein [Bacteroidota bacterium]
MSKETCILIPSAGFASADLLEHIIHHPEARYRLVVSDMNEHIAARKTAHAFYCSPATKSDAYLPFILDVCRKEKVDVIFPGKSADAHFFATHENLFRSENIHVVLSPAQTIFDTLDKAKSIGILAKAGLTVPQSYEVDNIEQFNDAVSKLGYPDKPVCIKPSRYPSESGRGFRIIDPSVNIHHRMFWEQPSELYFVGINQVLEAMKHEQEFPPQLVMEYLPYEEYSIYCFCDGGKPVYIIPNRRISLYQMSTMEAVVDFNEEISETCRRICEAFHFEYLVNIQLKYSVDRKPKLVEINPRLAGTIMLPVMAGADLIHFAIQKALGKDYNKEAVVKNGYRITRELIAKYDES